jgi:hypothetical protein
MWWVFWVVVVFLATSVVVYMRATQNLLFYIKWFRLYWILRDNGTPSTPRLTRSFMRQTSPPWWRGTGIQLRVGKTTFQVGILREKAVPVSVTDMEDDAGGLLAQLGGRELDLDAKTIRKEWI